MATSWAACQADSVAMPQTNDRWTVAVGLDNVAPREKSIRKLALFQCDRAYVVCRSGIILRIQ
ncbi:hypothetical protein BI312_25265 (plasmid) [Xanthomonas citri pv. citri]|nr:hypothetical protein [Xanthomonas citri]AOL21965.1 hypothetical protein BGK55_21530 [Xanthomonas citri pv. malvacearum]APR18183.1 hypothetical protein BI315_25175 [Xanthomonas citri pv. citri]APR22851.1 hypothetical protein BI316_24975 [Xanthomonas citri pv. citri]OLR69291.1 hypothetical protein BI312_25265 [Xanthomonas citri pv. citri]PWE94556.1 hypothetical protein TP44_22525 [Xanthomonas citri pv. citri]